MIVSLKLPDELYEEFVALDAKNPRAAMERTLSQFKGVDPTRPAVILGTKELAVLGNLLEHPISSFDDLVERVKRTANVSVESVGEIKLSTGQRTRLKDMEKFSGLGAEYIKNIVQRAIVTLVGP